MTAYVLRHFHLFLLSPPPALASLQATAPTPVQPAAAAAALPGRRWAAAAAAAVPAQLPLPQEVPSRLLPPLREGAEIHPEADTTGVGEPQSLQ